MKETTPQRAEAPEAQQNIIDVGLTEFAFGMPAEPVSGGNVIFEFTNRGEAHHEVGFWRLEEGTTMEDIERALEEGGPRRACTTRNRSIR